MLSSETIHDGCLHGNSLQPCSVLPFFSFSRTRVQPSMRNVYRHASHDAGKLCITRDLNDGSFDPPSSYAPSRFERSPPR